MPIHFASIRVQSEKSCRSMAACWLGNKKKAVKENLPIGEPLGEDRGVVALIYIPKI